MAGGPRGEASWCSATPTTMPRPRALQEERVLRLFTAARRNGLEFLLEVIPSKVGTGR